MALFWDDTPCSLVEITYFSEVRAAFITVRNNNDMIKNNSRSPLFHDNDLWSCRLQLTNEHMDHKVLFPDAKAWKTPLNSDF